MNNTIMVFLTALSAGILSTLLYLFLHYKTKIELKYLYSDNIAVAVLSFIIAYGLNTLYGYSFYITLLIVLPLAIVSTAFILTMIRFWRTPSRNITASPDQIVSPADGRVIYIKKIEKGEIPVSIKNDITSKLEELLNTCLLTEPCWLIGINMTPFDVHKNCAPVSGEIVLNQHFKGKFLSLKEPRALNENERNTYIIKSEKVEIGIVQIASRLVRRIDTYVKKGQNVRQGEWIGMIRFGSQVDVILPFTCLIKTDVRDQVYAGTTVIAEIN